MAQTQDRIESTTNRLSLDQRATLQDYTARAAWPSGFQIYERGANADGVFVVLSGRVILRSRVRAGRGFVPWIATQGETFGAEGLSPSGRYATDARADDETQTLFLSSTKLRAFVREQPTHALAIIGQIMAERTTLLDKLRELTTLSVEQRIIASLQRMATQQQFLHHDGRIELCSAHYRLLCELVGATRESVSLVLGRLGGEGLVERIGNTLLVTPSPRLFERLSVNGDEVVLAAPLADTAGVMPALQ
jgi:CRP-like cAMP-binding protein